MRNRNWFILELSAAWLSILMLLGTARILTAESRHSASNGPSWNETVDWIEAKLTRTFDYSGWGWDPKPSDHGFYSWDVKECSVRCSFDDSKNLIVSERIELCHYRDSIADVHFSPLRFGSLGKSLSYVSHLHSVRSFKHLYYADISYTIPLPKMDPDSAILTPSSTDQPFPGILLKSIYGIKCITFLSSNQNYRVTDNLSVIKAIPESDNTSCSSCFIPWSDREMAPRRLKALKAAIRMAGGNMKKNFISFAGIAAIG